MTKRNVTNKPRGMRKLYALGEKRSIDLSLSENPLGCSPLVSRALKSKGFNFNDYPDPNGKRVKLALAAKLGFNCKQVFVGQGSEAIINVIPGVFAKPGDEVIVPALTFPMFSICSELAGLKVRSAPMSQELGVDLQTIVKMITRETRIIFICNPNNPTGSLLSREEVSQFIRRIPSSIIVVVDEANIEFGGESVMDLVFTNRNVIVLRTLSKGFGLANLRIGFAIASEKIVARLEEETPVFPVSGLSEDLAIIALQDDAFIAKTKRFVDEERNRMRRGLEGCGFKVFPSGANNLFVKLPKSLSISNFRTAMRKADISLVMGSAFAGFDDGFFRVSPRSREINTVFLETISQLAIEERIV